LEVQREGAGSRGSEGGAAKARGTLASAPSGGRSRLGTHWLPRASGKGRMTKEANKVRRASREADPGAAAKESSATTDGSASPTSRGSHEMQHDGGTKPARYRCAGCGPLGRGGHHSCSRALLGLAAVRMLAQLHIVIITTQSRRLGHARPANPKRTSEIRGWVGFDWAALIGRMRRRAQGSLGPTLLEVGPVGPQLDSRNVLGIRLTLKRRQFGSGWTFGIATSVGLGPCHSHDGFRPTKAPAQVRSVADENGLLIFSAAY
jgi:hypothetical protein